jgi:hypothetical protein
MKTLFDNEDRTEFLNLFIESRRSTITNMFLNETRQTPYSPAPLILFKVKEELRKRSQRGYGAQGSAELLRIVEDNPGKSLRFAAYCLDYVNTPAEEREQAKEARSQENMVRWMATKEPSAKQLAYLRRLGVTGTPATMQEASEIIAARLAERGGRR